MKATCCSGRLGGAGLSKALGKQSIYAQLDRPDADAYAIALEMMAAASQLRGTREGMAAFLEKRQPLWPTNPELRRRVARKWSMNCGNSV